MLKWFVKGKEKKNILLKFYYMKMKKNINGFVWFVE